MTLFSKKYKTSLIYLISILISLSNNVHAEMGIIKFNSNQTNISKTSATKQNSSNTNYEKQPQNLQSNKIINAQQNNFEVPEHPNHHINPNKQLTQSERYYYQNLDDLVNSLVLANKQGNGNGYANRQQYSHNAYSDNSFIRPVNYKINSPFGMRLHPILGHMKMHTGVDFAAPKGTPIRVAQNGVVVFSGEKGGYGNAVIVKHDQRYSSLYGHVSKLLVNVGDTVQQGQVIALVGDTGMATGPHLHFEIFEYGKRINPESKIAI